MLTCWLFGHRVKPLPAVAVRHLDGRVEPTLRLARGHCDRCGLDLYGVDVWLGRHGLWRRLREVLTWPR